MNKEFNLEELANSVRNWCDEHRISPANGQASDEISERTIRYYRTLGLLDPANGSYIKTFSEKHRLQLIAIRIYQARGIPLRKIREELYGKSQEDLNLFVKRIENEADSTIDLGIPFSPPSVVENWAMVPLNLEFMIISRNGRELPRAIVEKINKLIESAYPTIKSKSEISKN